MRNSKKNVTIVTMNTTPTANIKTLLKHYAIKQNSATVNFNEFCDYMRRYAQRYLEEQEELIKYVANSHDAVGKELELLTTDKKVVILNPNTDKKSIVVTAYFIEKFTSRYREIEVNPAIPFPVLSDLPKYLTQEIYEKKEASEFIFELLEKQNLTDEYLYAVNFARDVPSILLPSSVNILSVLENAVAKIRLMLKKEEYHDYFLKKIRISNPGKELSAKNFFNMVITKPTETLDSIKNSGDSFYYWTQLCYFIRQDYEKVKDFTQEDIAKLQAVQIIELCSVFFKNKAQQSQQRTTALKNLGIILSKPPYFFTKDDIAKFVDSKGVPLLGQYTEQDLSDYLHTETTALENNNLPNLLVFKVESGQRYFITKNKVLPLIIKLCSEARDAIRENLTKEWYESLREFENIPCMKEQKEFDKKLQEKVHDLEPILYALLNSNFLSLIHYETRNSQEPVSEKINLFSNGKLLPYSEILMLSRQEILTDAKIMLPFWYTIPFFSWLLSLFLKKPGAKEKKQEKKVQEETEESEKKEKKKTSTSKADIRKAIEQVENQLVPEGSTIDQELSNYLQQWNKQITKQTREQLTEDVNCLIRDYIRTTARTIKSSNFNIQRIENLANTLVKTPSLQKIREQTPLTKYTQLYILKLVKNM